MSHARQRAASCRPVLASSLFALLCTGSRVKAFSTQPQSKSPFCFSTSLFKWTSLAMGRKSNELLFPSTSLPTLQPWIFLVIRNRFDVHIAPLWHYFWRHQQFRILLQHHEQLFTACYCERGVSRGLDWFLQPVFVRGSESDNWSLWVGVTVRWTAQNLQYKC